MLFYRHDIKHLWLIISPECIFYIKDGKALKPTREGIVLTRENMLEMNWVEIS